MGEAEARRWPLGCHSRQLTVTVPLVVVTVQPGDCSHVSWAPALLFNTTLCCCCDDDDDNLGTLSKLHRQIPPLHPTAIVAAACGLQAKEEGSSCKSCCRAAHGFSGCREGEGGGSDDNVL